MCVCVNKAGVGKFRAWSMSNLTKVHLLHTLCTPPLLLPPPFVNVTVYFQKVPRFWLAMGVALIGFCCSLLYCTDAGLNFLDVIDFYINFLMILVGFFECFGAGWCYDILGQFDRLSRPVVMTFLAGNFGAVLVACGLWFGLEDNAAVGGFVGLALVYLAGLAVTWYLLRKKLESDSEGKWTMSKLWWELYFGNIVDLRDRMQIQVGRVPFVWCFLIKHFLPHLLIILFINLAQAQTEGGVPLMGHYGGYATWPFQVLGIAAFSFTLLVFLIGVFFPNLYEPLALPQTEEAKMELAKYKSKFFPCPNVFCYVLVLWRVLGLFGRTRPSSVTRRAAPKSSLSERACAPSKKLKDFFRSSPCSP
jgi:hypothetical protein